MTHANCSFGLLDKLHTRLRESYDDLFTNYVDPQEPFFDTDGERWAPVAGNSANGSSTYNAYATEEQLQAIQAEARQLAIANEFAINGHENRVSYVVGTGHRYRIAPKVTSATLNGTSTDDTGGLAAQAQDVMDRFLETSDWASRQQEIARRRDRDGEVFVRLFEQPDGTTHVRFVEPGQVATPRELQNDPTVRFGIKTEPHDVESVVTNYIDGQPVDAARIQHRKGQVDRNARRGLPLYYPVRKNLRRAEKLLRNMSVVAEIQSAIALIRRHNAGSSGTVQQFVSNSADASIHDTNSGQTHHARRYGPGTILDAPAGVQYDFPAAGLDASCFVTILQAELRAIASRLVMPEFMLTSDASNGNFASTLVSEGPAVKMFSRLQQEMIADDRAIMWRVLSNAVTYGLLPEQALSQLNIQITPPTLIVRNEREEAEVHRIELESGILSPQTWSQRRGLNYDQEQVNLATHAASTPAAATDT